ncbi:MAG: excalibur calcium-binding domain-containing protein [Akkermansiaceae bacterium]|nr:excalibur calcium-binding domain-containing protein [Akkermansiaceae bacterium]
MQPPPSSSILPIPEPAPTYLPPPSISEPPPTYVPPPALAPLPSAPYYSNCSQAHADGRYDIPRGDPSYRTKLDRDGDGYACE